MRINNGDLPAMPQSSNNGCPVSDEVVTGLSKREMFALHAPECPKWFESQWFNHNYDNKDYFDIVYLESETITNTLPAGNAALMKAWRYGFADIMLEG